MEIKGNLLYIAPTKKELRQVINNCIKYGISFEFMNGKELYFFIYSKADFDIKQIYLGEPVINIPNMQGL